MTKETICCNAETLTLDTFCPICKENATLEFDPDALSDKFAEIALENEGDYIQYMADRFGGTF